MPGHRKRKDNPCSTPTPASPGALPKTATTAFRPLNASAPATSCRSPTSLPTGSPPSPFLLYLLLAVPYGLGWLADFPRSTAHHIVIGLGLCASIAVAYNWPRLSTIPFIGTPLYLLPGLLLAASPILFAFYLMYGR